MAKRILIADDSVTIQKAFAMTFAGEDLTLVAARSADEGLSMAQRARPDLIIADGVMPGRSGYDLCSAIKSDPGLRGVPVFILASQQNPFDEARARQCAADGQFTKPFDSAALVTAVNDVLAKGTGAVAAVPAAVVPAGAFAFEPRPVPADDYGEISVGSSATPSSGVRPGAAVAPSRGRAEDEITPPPAGPTRPAAPPPALVSPTPPAPLAAPVMRPSLIPGMRPGLPGARPGAVPSRPSVAPAPQPMPLRPAAPQAPSMGSGTRTMMGLPAGGLQPPPRTAGPSYPIQPAPMPSSPVRAVEGRTPPPAVASSAAAQAVSAVSSRVAAQMASYSARGPEYEAIAKLSREIIEKIAWEIVPELAETIIREELQKRGRV